MWSVTSNTEWKYFPSQIKFKKIKYQSFPIKTIVYNVVADYQICMHEYYAFRKFFIHEHINEIMYVCIYYVCVYVLCMLNPLIQV